MQKQESTFLPLQSNTEAVVVYHAERSNLKPCQRERAVKRIICYSRTTSQTALTAFSYDAVVIAVAGIFISTCQQDCNESLKVAINDQKGSFTFVVNHTE